MASGGVATFTGLTINAASAGYTIRAISGGLTAAVTAPVDVTVGAVPHLAIFAAAGPVTTGSDFRSPSTPRIPWA